MKRKILDANFLSQLENMSLYLKNPMDGYFGGTRKSNTYGSTVDFADFREYMPGDDLRRIDWNVYGRFEKFYIKLFLDERQMHTQIFLDCSESMAWGQPEKAELMLKYAAAFGFLSVQALDKVSYMRMSEGDCMDLCGTVSGKDSFYMAMDKLSTVKFEGETDMEAAIKQCVNPGYSDGITIIISDFFTESNWKKAVDYLIYKKRQVVLLQILSPDEISPDFGGRLNLIDSESILEGDLRNTKMEINKSAVKAYKIALNDYQKEMETFCNSRNATFLTVSTDASIEEMLYKKGYEKELIR